MMRSKGWMVCSGMMWIVLGSWLLYKGVHLIAEGAFGLDPKHSWTSRFFGKPEEGALTLVGIGLLIGLIKGRFVLSKTVKRVCSRIASLPEPISFKEVYSASYLFLIGGMMLLGMSLRFVPLPLDFKGFIDVAVGSALINGSFLYFRLAFSHRSSSASYL